MSLRAKALVASILMSSVVLTACGSRVASSSGSPAPGSSSAAASANTASDVGVSPTQITVGSIVGLTSGLGPDTFSASRYGAQAYFDSVNAAGGVNGRTIKFNVCDDKGQASNNEACARKLADDDKVFALAGVTSFDYAGASYLNSKDVPDVAGQPIDNTYDRYSHMYGLYGSYYPRDNKAPGYNGTLYGGTETFQYMKQKLGVKTAGIVYFNVGPSQRYAQSEANGLKATGINVVQEEINLSLQNYTAAVLDMKSKGVDIIFDAMNDYGNVNLCQAMAAQSLTVKAKVTTTQGWTDAVKTTFNAVPNCRNVMYAIGQSQNYDDTSVPAVATFRAAISKLATKPAVMNMWVEEGYISAMWLTDAIRSCGSDVTRACVEKFMNRTNANYTAGGLITARNFSHLATPPATERSCINVARWQDSANGGAGGWVSQVPDMNTTCFSGPNISYSAGT
jgi:branched-chain amino acid transport system substrate-binding protein